MKASQERFVFYASGHRAPDRYRRQYVPVFHRAHEARCFLDKFIAGKPFVRDGNVIRLDSHPDFTLRCDQLDEVLAAPIANEELRADYAQHILRFKYGTWDEVHTRDEPVSDDGEVIERAPKPERERRPDVPPAFVTITALCAGSDVLPTHARAALRASGRTKPAYGWAFDPKDVPAIKKLIGIG